MVHVKDEIQTLQDLTQSWIGFKHSNSHVHVMTEQWSNL